MRKSISRILILGLLYVCAADAEEVVVNAMPVSIQDLPEKSQFIFTGTVSAAESVGPIDAIVYKMHLKATVFRVRVSVETAIKGAPPAEVMLTFTLPDVRLRNTSFADLRDADKKRGLFFVNADKTGGYALTDPLRLVLMLPPKDNSAAGAPDNLTLESVLEREIMSAVRVAETRKIALYYCRIITNPAKSSLETLRECSASSDVEIAKLSLACRIRWNDATIVMELLAKNDRLHFGSDSLGFALSDATSKISTEALIQIAQAGREDLSVAAVRGLRHRRENAATRALASLLESELRDIQYHAMMGLSQLTGKTRDWTCMYAEFDACRGSLIPKWRAWWEAEGKTKYSAPANEKE